ncbi:hydroxymethylglutaryl-CoA synthase [Acidobacteriia bacterium AH_259_A11_L15]|nr:hydroxymethylglutaryl-CoA synthase [Acidobacteriia bacterium AH_259_A11_L15]
MSAPSILLRTEHRVGIASYGAYVPRGRIRTEAIAACWGLEQKRVPIRAKSVPGPDEDTATMCIEAAQNALRRVAVAADQIRAVWVGTESKPYAVKPTSTVVAEALGLTPFISAADMEFACKAGSEAMQTAMAYVGSGMARYALAIGMDTAQSRPGDSLEYTAAAGGAAFLFGRAENAVAEVEGSLSYVTDTPDFFRHAHRHYPQHGQRFTGDAAYFHHSQQATRALLDALGRAPQDYRWAVFHQPNPKFVRRLARQLGFTEEQIRPGFLAPAIGNTYAGSSLLGLAAVLDIARPGDRILFTSYGSGAGSDALSLVVTPRIGSLRAGVPRVRDYLERKQEIGDYGVYLRLMKKIHRE